MSETMNAERIAEIRARVAAATPGPWRFHSLGCSIAAESPAYPAVFVSNRDGTVPTSPDASFAAHARSDVPDLLDALEASRAEVERLRAWQARAARVFRNERDNCQVCSWCGAEGAHSEGDDGRPCESSALLAEVPR